VSRRSRRSCRRCQLGFRGFGLCLTNDSGCFRLTLRRRDGSSNGRGTHCRPRRGDHWRPRVDLCSVYVLGLRQRPTNEQRASRQRPKQGEASAFRSLLGLLRNSTAHSTDSTAFAAIRPNCRPDLKRLISPTPSTSDGPGVGTRRIFVAITESYAPSVGLGWAQPLHAPFRLPPSTSRHRRESRQLATSRHDSLQQAVTTSC